MIDYDILKAFEKREMYERYARFVQKSSLTEDAYTIFEAMGQWLKDNPSVDAIKWPGFKAWYTLVRHVKMNKDKLAAHKQLIDMLATREMDDDVSFVSLLQGLAKRDYAARMADIALRIADGDYAQSFDSIERLLKEFNDSSGKSDAVTQRLGSFSVDAIKATSGPGLNWRLSQSLGQAMGPIRKGDLIVFGKRPDAGGTTFLASEVSYMVDQIEPDECILWINNEEEGNKVRTRITQARIGWETEEMDEAPEAAFNEYEMSLPNPQMIKVYDDAKAHVRDIEALCKQLKPRLIIFDQLRKVKGYDSAGEEHDKLEGLFNWAREIAKEYAPVIVVHQLGTEADNKKWIGYEAMFGSKTGLQGEADAIITMGRVYANGNTRYLFIPKNKLKTPGDKAKRNGRFEVTILPDTARYEDKAYIPG